MPGGTYPQRTGIGLRRPFPKPASTSARNEQTGVHRQVIAFQGTWDLFQGVWDQGSGTRSLYVGPALLPGGWLCSACCQRPSAAWCCTRWQGSDPRWGHPSRASSEVWCAVPTGRGGGGGGGLPANRQRGNSSFSFCGSPAWSRYGNCAGRSPGRFSAGAAGKGTDTAGSPGLRGQAGHWRGSEARGDGWRGRGGRGLGAAGRGRAEPSRRRRWRGGGGGQPGTGRGAGPNGCRSGVL